MSYGLACAEDRCVSTVSREIGVVVASKSCISSLWIEVCKSTPSLGTLLRNIWAFVSVMASTSTQVEYTERNHLYSGGTCTYQQGANAKGLTSTLDLDWTRIWIALA